MVLMGSLDCSRRDAAMEMAGETGESRDGVDQVF